MGRPILLLLLLCCLQLAAVARAGGSIIMFVPTTSMSNVLMFARVGNVLAAHGHSVTLHLPTITPADELMAGVRKECPLCAHYMLVHAVDKVGNTLGYEDVFNYEVDDLAVLFSVLEKACDAQLRNATMVGELRAAHYDMAVVNYYGWCSHGLAHVAGAESVVFLSSGAYNHMTALVNGEPSPPSFVPLEFIAADDSMSFVGRMRSFAQTALFDLAVGAITRSENAVFRRRLSADFPDLCELAQRQTDFYLVNSVEQLEYPRPMFSNVAHIGGLFMGPEHFSGLPERWQKTLADDKVTQFVLMSLGTVVRDSVWPARFRKAMMHAAERQPDVTFIWRFNETFLADDEKPPSNMIIESWLPQSALLGHAKCAAFVSHCGYNSLMETAAAGVPSVGIPLFGDQPRNARVARRQGFGVVLDKLVLDGDMLHEGIVQAAKLRPAAKRMAAMIARRPTAAKQTLLDWVDYILEFKHVPNMQSPAKYYGTLKYYGVDVICAYVGILLTCMAVMVYAVRALWTRLRKDKVE